MRIIRQITAAQGEDGVEAVYALAEDGTLWCGTWSAGHLTWREVPPLPPAEPAKSLEAQGYLHVDGEHLQGLTTWLAYTEQRLETAIDVGPEERVRILKEISREAATCRDRLAAIRKGARTP